MKIVIAGTAYPYRGGIATFNERLASELQKKGNEVKIYNFTLQYPSFLFPGKTQYSTDAAPEDLAIERTLNSVNPFSWISTGRRIRREKPDLVIIPYWSPYLAPALGAVARVIGKKYRKSALVHNLIPHEGSIWSKVAARFFCKGADAFVALSGQVRNDILSLMPGSNVKICPHPVYDHFGQSVPKAEARSVLNLPQEADIILSFGLVRDYKGIDWLIEAFSRLKDSNAILVIAGEFYSDPKAYKDLASRLGAEDRIIWRSEFIPEEQVRYYFSAADLIALTYKSATQSGVAQIAYNFEKPMLVTNVGGLGETVPDGVAGYVVSPDVESIRKGLERFLGDRPDFSEGLKTQKKLFCWDNMVETFTD